ncbi:MAG: class II fructose-bisphosphatase [Rhodospirillales bacterium]|nr:class II fructose-bisphosphatase [Rhodospirillales bacterium]
MPQMDTQMDTRLCEENFVYALRTTTEAAARAAYRWIGRGSQNEGVRAAVEGMKRSLGALPINGVIVIGEESGSDSPLLRVGEQIGRSSEPLQYDIALDPVEGTSYLAKGMTNAMAVIAVAPRGAMFNPGPTFYMDKLVVPPQAAGKVDQHAPVGDRLRQLSAALNKPVEDLTIFVLEKPRHRGLVERIHEAGARVALYPAGDIAGALMAATPDSGIDALMGTGGTPEGIISACAIRALGGELKGRLDPQLPSERRALKDAGLDTSRWYGAEDLVTSDQVYFCATGITTGLLFDGIERSRSHERTQSFMIGPRGDRQILTTYHDRDDVLRVAASSAAA